MGPDAESRPWVNDLAERLGVTCAVAQKVRLSDRSVEIGFADPELFAGRPVLLVDDIVSSGGTLIACAKALAAAGAEAVDAIVTHALFPQSWSASFVGAGIRSVRSTNSVPHPTNAIILDDTYVAALRSEMQRYATVRSNLMSLTVRFCGAARTVTGSCFLSTPDPGACWSTAVCFKGRKP